MTGAERSVKEKAEAHMKAAGQEPMFTLRRAEVSVSIKLDLCPRKGPLENWEG